MAEESRRQGAGIAMAQVAAREHFPCLYVPHQWQGITGVFLCLAWYSATSTASEIQTRCILGFWRMYSIICAPKLVLDAGCLRRPRRGCMLPSHCCSVFVCPYMPRWNHVGQSGAASFLVYASMACCGAVRVCVSGLPRAAPSVYAAAFLWSLHPWTRGDSFRMRGRALHGRQVLCAGA